MMKRGKARYGRWLAVAGLWAVAAWCRAEGVLTNTLWLRSTAPVTNTFILSYAAEGMDLEVSIDTEDTDFNFKKEPDFGQREIVRGALRLGTNRQDNLGFAWDRAQGRLYLDLGHNLDLTDDAAGVVEADDDEWYQEFDDIPLVNNSGPVPIPYQVGLRFSHRGYAYVEINSGWRGEVQLGDATWHVTVVDNLDGQLGLGDKLIVSQVSDEPGGVGVVDRLPLVRDLTLNDQSYKLSFAFVAGASNPALQVTAETVAPPAGFLVVTGRHIAYLRLAGDDRAAIFARPPERFLWPAGRYTDNTIYLQAGSGSPFSANLKDISITQGGFTTLDAGAPLEHKVRVTRSMAGVNLSYRLLGLGGEEYQAGDDSQLRRPRFTIYRDGHELDGGHFEYG